MGSLAPIQSPPGGQQFGEDPIGLDKAEERSLTEEVSTAQDATDGPAGGGGGESRAPRQNRGQQFRLGEAPSWAPEGLESSTHPSATKKKISGRSKGTSTRKLVL